MVSYIFLFTSSPNISLALSGGCVVEVLTDAVANSAAELNIGIICACMPVVYVLFKDAAIGTLSWASNLRSWASRSRTAVEVHPYADVEMSLPKLPGQSVNSIESFKPPVSNFKGAEFQATPPQTLHREVFTHVSAQNDYHPHMHRFGSGVDGMSSYKTWQLSRTYSPAESNSGLCNGGMNTGDGWAKTNKT